MDSIMPTGVTTEKNLYSWFEAGVHCVGIGSDNTEMINDENTLQEYLIEVSKILNK